jgi:hypothetical protein
MTDRTDPGRIAFICWLLPLFISGYFINLNCQIMRGKFKKCKDFIAPSLEDILLKTTLGDEKNCQIIPVSIVTPRP